MSDLLVHGGRPVSGTVIPSGNKNAALPMLCATLLTREPVTIRNIPDISDAHLILRLFKNLGSKVEHDLAAETLTVEHDFDQLELGPDDLPTGIRSTVLLVAPLLVRGGRLTFDTEAKGCALGMRELDPHLAILQKFDTTISSTRPYLLEMPDRPEGRSLWADYASVTATETFMMTAATADGTSVLMNAASEPHVQALGEMLVAMGAKIEGLGTSRLTITGAKELSGADVRVPDDHHEVATFLAIGGVTGGEVTVKTDVVEHMELILRQFAKLGLSFDTGPDHITVTGWTREVEVPFTPELMPKIEAAPWPYFPADLLPQAIGVAVGCTGQVMFWNKIYEGALGWSSELPKFGARVHLSDPHRLVMLGGGKLRPAVVEAPYIIRVAVALFIAAIQVDGMSKIRHADPIRRAHPRFVEKLTALGAQVEWI